MRPLRGREPKARILSPPLRPQGRSVFSQFRPGHPPLAFSYTKQVLRALGRPRHPARGWTLFPSPAPRSPRFHPGGGGAGGCRHPSSYQRSARPRSPPHSREASPRPALQARFSFSRRSGAPGPRTCSWAATAAPTHRGPQLAAPPLPPVPPPQRPGWAVLPEAWVPPASPLPPHVVAGWQPLGHRPAGRLGPACLFARNACYTRFTENESEAQRERCPGAALGAEFGLCPPTHRTHRHPSPPVGTPPRKVET